MSVFVLTIGIGIAAGLRALTPPALVSWAARSGWLHLEGSPLAFMGSTLAVAVFTLAALFEYVTDTLPTTPARTVPLQLGARILTGGLSAACLSVSAGSSPLAGAVLGAIGVLIGTFGGYQVRKRLVNSLKVKDIFIAVPEDLVAIGLSYLLVAAR